MSNVAILAAWGCFEKDSGKIYGKFLCYYGKTGKNFNMNRVGLLTGSHTPGSVDGGKRPEARGVSRFP
jgi:hypothetical protein